MERTLSRLNARRATCTTIKILLSASSLTLSGITSASAVFTRMSVKRAFAQVQNTFLSIGPLQNSLHLEQTILCDQNKREGRVDPALQFGARTIREATLPRQGADLIRLSCNGLADVGDRRERGRRWYVSIVSALDCRGRCAATSLNYSRGKDGARRRPPSAILNCEDRAKTKGNEDGEIRDFRVSSGSRKKKESKLLVKITRSTCTSNGMNISWRSNSKIPAGFVERRLSSAAYYRFIVVEFWGISRGGWLRALKSALRPRRRWWDAAARDRYRRGNIVRLPLHCNAETRSLRVYSRELYALHHVAEEAVPCVELLRARAFFCHCFSPLFSIEKPPGYG